MHRRHFWSAAVLALFLTPLPAAAQSRTAAAARSSEAAAPRETRDDWQRAPEIFAALGAVTGSRIADLGSGSGWLTERLARRVGPTGRVFAADISESALEQLAERIERDTLRNVELILAESDDPRLPYGTLDGVVIVNAYHEMTERVAVLQGIKRALKPGGTLVILDTPAPDSLRSRREQMREHQLDLELARDDLEACGFEIVREERNFVEGPHGDHTHRQWMLVARRVKK